LDFWETKNQLWAICSLLVRNDRATHLYAVPLDKESLEKAPDVQF
jgi:hypothetical protein